MLDEPDPYASVQLPRVEEVYILEKKGDPNRGIGLLLSLILGACGGPESVDECRPKRAFPFDSARSCVSNVAEVVGCTLDELGTAVAPCVKRLADGALFIATEGSSFRDPEQWGECTREESQMTLVFCAGD